ncbi:MAG TPA: FG-GAP repeat protein [Actinomycetes bacterium]|nr:FG-GAP repeat protein [Actinomycetes bacterium]
MRTHPSSLTVLAAAAVCAALAGPVSPPAAATQVTGSVAPYDFNGDGRVDLAVGIPDWDGFDDADGQRVSNVGAVVVMWGGRDRVPETTLTPGEVDDGGLSRAGARFGSALASDDFDRDGYADLAVGSPYEEGTPSHIDPGMGVVRVYYGDASGLGSRQAVLPHAGLRGFGHALVATDLTGDGWPDLAVGAPFTAVPGAPTGFQTGEVAVLHGGPGGFDRGRSSLVARPSLLAEHFGEVLAAGDVNGDGATDLVEGAAGDYEQWLADAIRPGHLTWALGATGTGPTAARYVGGRPAGALAVGDVTGDGIDDVVSGSVVSRRFRPGAPMPPGRVTLFRGGSAGPETPGASVSQDAALVPGRERAGDRFGAALELTDLDRDGRQDVLVGVPGKHQDAGRVVVLRGARGGFAQRDAIVLDQASGGIPGRPETGDRFGAAVAALDVSGDGRDDLAFGAPGEDGRRGSVTVVRTRGIFYVPSGVAAYSLESLQRPGGGPERKFGSVLGG